MIRCLINLVLIFITINEALAVKVCNSSVINNGQSRIGIFISPIVSELPIHEIEIYWNNMKPYEKIVLLDTSRLDSPIVLYNVSSNGPSGFERTGVQAKFVPSSHLSFTQRCTGYSVALLTATSDLKEVNCLKTQPTWMKERQNILGPRRISEIFLPGTHDSASYAEDDTGNFITNNAVTQDTDILGQLIHGVRFLDIRVGHYPLSSEIWWTNHGPLYRSVPLKTVIDQVKQFLNNTEEIVIMDFHEFPVGFNDIAIHRKLVSYLEDKFQDYFLANSHGWFATLNDIWSSGKRLIIGYRHTRIVQERDSVWPCVQHQWGNVRNVKDLYRHLNQIESSDSDSRVRPRAAMAELTANVIDVLYNRLGSIRDMAHRVNANVTNWYSSIWQYSANIVAVDFVRGTGIVEAAIKANENRHFHCRY
ncbi:PI-PLC X domain-containing protein 1 isoform X1 [Nomia melanderi]|uniref:PI-PLC X domain-containing protein 1 isoform X1 n=1 Tax=Nomia melanderi TaxID=2448451 RepID=UPI001304099E|nr:PI-PLC X domain-containing protein 1-like isoform X1 [Nomia melanderi]XP_031839286.1 PI-PLC X domain-containing protein 1-like isoform X1 [Nomia melanderi]XP_031839296.1 PI-PLC X domain-containing protein 1-like isoform X1 [Nomia melanderi]XP_031839305.1 PI-PLC X domain-containing protein 1-like isoform X1 [Nomia melanderi]XP_031839315.1 PI-PLC X domain-containing protein 1-like isoform X1 [Nomia melanderi]